MEKDEKIYAAIRDLFASQGLAVLSTQQRGQPYASLVAFVASDDLKHIYFVTPKTTRKFANLTASPSVAFIVNNSMNQDSDFHKAIAVTGVGQAEEISGPQRKDILKHYLEKHPHLEDFARSPTCGLVRVTVKSYYMVKNFQNVMELHLSK
jgi:nitroimidazol reductase NimA-like FMN-containing flavoprotein (pyridoxamine 5'-phosphate oxidase superfamily)